MHSLCLLVACVACSIDVPDGSLIVLENSNPVVEAYTKSEVTHVGLVLNQDGEPYVYEATPKVVRRIELTRYYDELSDFNRRRGEDNKLRVRLYSPARPYSRQELAKLQSFLDGQLGRRYSIKGYVRQRQVTGIHCADLVSSALSRTGRFQFDQTYTVSPARLVAEVAPQHQAPREVALPDGEPQGTWCERSWNWWSGFFTWCGWACGETWMFCRS